MSDPLALGLEALDAVRVDLASIGPMIEKIRAAIDPMLARRAEIEAYLLDCASGKHPLPTPEVCRILALRLGTPKEAWAAQLKAPLP